MLTSDFDFHLPEHLIAQQPLAARDESRLLVLDRTAAALEYAHFHDVTTRFTKGDVLVLNNSRVIRARLRGVNSATGGEFEILLLEEMALNNWWTMMRPGKRARIGTRIAISDTRGARTNLTAIVTETNEEGHRRLQFDGTANILDALTEIGEVPLPPYIHRSELLQSDAERYQTVFAQPPGSVAAPTAGLHFTEPLLNDLGARGVEVCFITLHVGLGTFAPVKADEISAHKMHEERFAIPEDTSRAINSAKASKRRVIAVGTTALRTLEAVAAGNDGHIVAGPGKTGIFIYPPYEFKIVDALLTNFHLPRSTLLMLVSAFASPGKTNGRELILSAYAEAVAKNYRFFSYGDAMLITDQPR
jgi:S-adenosylmethionine:tRNA ribosyltransferase-isomerase